MKRLAVGCTLSCCCVVGTAADVPYCPPSLEASLTEGAPGEDLLFPRGHLFQPLLADPLEPHFLVSYRYYERTTRVVHAAVIGAGESFALWRRVGGCAADGLQIDIAGGGVARFELDRGRNDLIDGDFTLALPVSWRRGNWAWRARLYHNSAHLGENLLYQEQKPTRSKASHDSLDFIVSYDRDSLRFYGGPEYMLNHYPSLKPLGLHLGAEYYGSPTLFGGVARWVGGVDVKSWAEYGFSPDYSVKAGLSFGGQRETREHMQVLLELYDGRENRGVFYDEKIRYLGIGAYFGF